MKLYGFGKSRWQRCLWAVAELGIPCERVEISPRDPELLRLNPYGTVPVLQDDSLVLTESAAICLYLAEKHPEKGLLPERGTAESGRHMAWVSFAICEVEQPLWRMERNRLVYPEEERVAADIGRARKDFHRAAAVLEKALEGKEYLLGERFSMADVIMGYALVWAGEEGLLGSYPTVSAYLERLRARPAFPEAL